MTDSNKTLIAALLDRSGSMSTSKQATEEGWLELIQEQAVQEGRCEVTLAQFDTEYEIRYLPTDISAVPEFVVHPRGGTALLDATYRFITEVGTYLAALPEEQRPGKVICLIMTDGGENQSRATTWAQVKQLITQQREVYDWEFVFLGANIDAIDVGARLGMERDSALTYSSRSFEGNKRAYRMASEGISKVRRREGKFGFVESERREAMGE